MCFDDSIKNCANLTTKLLTDAYKSKVINFTLDEDPLQRRVYFPSFVNSLKIVLSQFKETYIVLMEYASIRGNDSLDYAKNATWNLFHSYIDAHSQILIDEYTVDGVQAISIMQQKCANMTFSDQSKYNIMFQRVTQE